MPHDWQSIQNATKVSAVSAIARVLWLWGGSAGKVGLRGAIGWTRG